MQNQSSENSELNESIYLKLKNVARQLMLNERDGHTLSVTDLVHEAYLKISESDYNTPNSDTQYFVLARQMRRLLVDYGRRKAAAKHGGEVDKIHFTEGLNVAGQHSIDFTGINAAIDELETVSERCAKIIELYYFVGMPREQIAKIMNVSMSTFAREVHFAKVYIGDYLNENHLKG